jgi:hypothetical protein
MSSTKAGATGLVNLPMHYVIDDAMYFNFNWLGSEPSAQRITDPERVCDIWWAAFRQQYNVGGYLNVCMHPFQSGRALRIAMHSVSDFAIRRSLLTLPYYYHFDDQFFLMFPREGTGLEHPDVLLRNWRGEFAAQYKRGRAFHMTLHPQHIGWSNRLQMLDEFLAELREYPSLWNPTAAECAHYWLETYPAAVHLRLEPSIWQDYPGSLS